MPVIDDLRTIIVEHTGTEADKIVPTATFKDLGADSLDLVEIVMALEEKFSIEISDEEATTLKTISDVLEYLKGKGVKMGNGVKIISLGFAVPPTSYTQSEIFEACKYPREF